MPQFARPSADTTVGNWKTHNDGTTNLYTTIDEVTADDADYIKSELAPSNSVYVTKLSSVEDPQSSSGHILRYRYRKNSSGGAQIDLTVQLRQGYASEASQGTLIASASVTDLPATFTTGTYTLSAAEADSITDYTDLYIRLIANQV